MKRQPRCEIYRADEYGYGWRLIAPNGQILVQAEGFTTKRRAQTGALAVLQVAYVLFARCGPDVDPWEDCKRWFVDAA